MQRKYIQPVDQSGSSDLSEISSFSSPSVSSRKQEWSGILVEQRRLCPGIVEVPALSEHFLGLHMRQALPIEFAQQREGVTRQAIFREGDVTLLSAGQACNWRHEAGQAEVLQIRLQPEFLRAIAEAINLNPERVEMLDTFVFQDLQIQAIGFAFLQELQAPGIGGRLFMESQAVVLALHLLRQYSVFAPPDQQGKVRIPSAKVRHVIDYIHENLGSDLSLFNLAEVAQLSPYHLLRLFKQATGQTPYQYYLLARLHQAQRLLRQRDASISEVALLMGFADQSHLTRHFKQAFGITPAVFVREQRV